MTSRLHRDTASEIAAVPSSVDRSERELMANEPSTECPSRDHALLALAAHVEELAGPCRNTDVKIAQALGLPWDYSADWRGWGFDTDGKPIEKPVAFPYTASIDHAKRLLPEGFDVCLTWSTDEPAGAAISPAMQVAQWHGEAWTPAGALCAAALRARGHS